MSGIIRAALAGQIMMLSAAWAAVAFITWDAWWPLGVPTWEVWQRCLVVSFYPLFSLLFAALAFAVREGK